MKLMRITHYALMLCLASCTIEPPLHLPQELVQTQVPLVLHELEVVWDVTANWQNDWWYGWDEEDVRRWGRIEYPQPTNFEVRRFYQGEAPSTAHVLEESFTVFGNKFKRRYNFGYHDMLLWSNIDSKDGTQTVVINEQNPDRVVATTTSASALYARRAVAQKKQPDIFYSAYERNFYISRNTADYDRFDPVENAWVKEIRSTLDPMVYIYLVQVVVYNNKGRIVGLADQAMLTGLADGVTLNTGRTLMNDVDVTFDMRMKHGLAVPAGHVADVADIMGAMFTTFGLCDMDPWHISRGANYVGSRGDLPNNVLLDLMFSNQNDAVFAYDVTSQMQHQAHGGVVTIEIDADTITVPQSSSGGGSGFKPTVEEYADSVVHEFGV